MTNQLGPLAIERFSQETVRGPSLPFHAPMVSHIRNRLNPGAVPLGESWVPMGLWPSTQPLLSDQLV